MSKSKSKLQNTLNYIQTEVNSLRSQSENLICTYLRVKMKLKFIWFGQTRNFLVIKWNFSSLVLLNISFPCCTCRGSSSAPTTPWNQNKKGCYVEQDKAWGRRKCFPAMKDSRQMLYALQHLNKSCIPNHAHSDIIKIIITIVFGAGVQFNVGNKRGILHSFGNSHFITSATSHFWYHLSWTEQWQNSENILHAVNFLVPASNFYIMIQLV